MSKSKNVLRSFFSSIKLTIALLVLLVLLFMAATFIPRPYGIAWLADLYHSPLFYILMGLLSINLIICSINRLPVTLKQYKSPHPPPSVLFENLKNERIIFTDKIDAACRAVEASLTAKFSSVKKLKTAKGIIFYREEGRFSLFGVYIVHLSILIIIAAAIIGSVFGLEADVHLQEGESASVIQLNKDKGPYQFDFSVRCDQFVVEFYHTGAPKTYRSDLSFIREGNVVHKGSVLVNHPLPFEGFRFYQSSYGISPETKAVLTYTAAGRKSTDIMVKQGDVFHLPAKKARATVLRVEENIMQLGPAVKLSIEADKKHIQFWVFQHIKEIAEVNPGLLSEVPLFNPGLFKPLVFSLKTIEKRYYTGLRVVRDPGVPFALTGGVFLLVGLITIYFTAHQRIWVLVEQQPQRVKISVNGISNRYSASLAGKLNRLRQRISGEIAT